jgi:hypothetical protein
MPMPDAAFQYELLGTGGTLVQDTGAVKKIQNRKFEQTNRYGMSQILWPALAGEPGCVWRGLSREVR